MQVLMVSTEYPLIKKTGYLLFWFTRLIIKNNNNNLYFVYACFGASQGYYFGHI
jgi:hypothetical protein